MDTEVDDMFTILSFLQLCKMYKKLKQRKKSKTKKSVSISQYSTPNIVQQPLPPEQKLPLQVQSQSPVEIHHNDSIEEEIETYSLAHQEEPYEEVDESIENRQSDEEEVVHYENENDHLISVIEEKPHVMIETIPHDDSSYVDQNYQYEISFEVNGEHRHVVLGSGSGDGGQADAETKYECEEVEDHEICYEVTPEDQEVILESTEEIQDDICADDAEICYEEVNTEQIVEEYSIQEEVVPDPPKKRRRRRRRGQNADPEEEEPPREKKPRVRHFKTNPENLNRQQEGYFGRVFLNLKANNEEQFLILTRMKRNAYDKLLKLVFRAMSKRAQHIYPEERLSITLLHLAHATPFHIIAKQYKLGKTTVRNLILETCEILYEVLQPMYMKEPTSEDYLRIAQDFKNQWKLSNCVGVLDGKHISIKKPRRTVLEEYNMSAISSLVILAACDAKYIFRSATVTIEPHQSSFAKGIMNNTLPLPPNAPLADGSPIDFPYYYIGDTSFPLRSNLMRPYVGAELDDREIFYNYKLADGQTVIENAFIMLSSMWKVLLTTFDLTPINCESIILACIVLHNYVMLNGGDRWHNSDGTLNAELPHNVDENTEWINVETVQYQESLESITKFGGESNGTGNELRDTLAEFFFQEGPIETQAEFFDI